MGMAKSMPPEVLEYLKAMGKVYGKQIKEVLQRGQEVPDKGYCFSCRNCGLEITCHPQEIVQ